MLSRLQDLDKPRPRLRLRVIDHPVGPPLWSMPTVRARTLAMACGVTPQTVRNWRRRRCFPRAKHWHHLLLLRSLVCQARD
jgi:hypothetical protein